MVCHRIKEDAKVGQAHIQNKKYGGCCPRTSPRVITVNPSILHRHMRVIFLARLDFIQHAAIVTKGDKNKCMLCGFSFIRTFIHNSSLTQSGW